MRDLTNLGVRGAVLLAFVTVISTSACGKDQHSSAGESGKSSGGTSNGNGAGEGGVPESAAGHGGNEPLSGAGANNDSAAGLGGSGGVAASGGQGGEPGTTAGAGAGGGESTGDAGAGGYFVGGAGASGAGGEAPESDPYAACQTCTAQACTEMDTKCAAKDPSCHDVLRCIQASGCAIGSENGAECYCGSVDADTCFDDAADPSVPQGVCKAAIESAAGSVVPAAVAAVFFNPTNPFGSAMIVLDCQLNTPACAAPCNL